MGAVKVEHYASLTLVTHIIMLALAFDACSRSSLCVFVLVEVWSGVEEFQQYAMRSLASLVSLFSQSANECQPVLG